VQNIYTSYNFSHFAIYPAKFIKVGGTMTKFWQKQKCSFLRHGVEWCGYPAVKKFQIYLYSFWHDPRTWQTHRRTDTTWWHRLCLHSNARQKANNKQEWM